MRRLIDAILFCFFLSTLYSQQNWNGEQLVLQNNVISRIIVLKNGEFSTQSFRLKNYPYNFVGISGGRAKSIRGVENISKYKWYGRENPEEFSFLLNDKKVTGKTGWKLVDITEEKDGETEVHKITLMGTAKVNREFGNCSYLSDIS